MRSVRMLVLLALSASATAQALERWSLPDPEELVKASQALCADQAKSALLAWRYRAQGRSKDEVLALIPESPKAIPLRLVSAMRENVDDAFAHPEISHYTYYAFRSEVCLRETLTAWQLPPLSAALASIVECQKTHGPDRSVALFRCVKAAVEALESK